MKYSKLFGKTVKEISKDATLISHKLLHQAGFIRESVAGRYYFLPLGIRVRDKIVGIIEEEMNKAGAQKNDHACAPPNGIMGRNKSEQFSWL